MKSKSSRSKDPKTQGKQQENIVGPGDQQSGPSKEGGGEEEKEEEEGGD